MSGVTGSLDRYEKHAVPYRRDKTELEFHGKFLECWKHLTGMCWYSWQWMGGGFGKMVCACLVGAKGGWIDVSDKSSVDTWHNLSVTVCSYMSRVELTGVFIDQTITVSAALSVKVQQEMWLDTPPEPQSDLNGARRSGDNSTIPVIWGARRWCPVMMKCVLFCAD